MKANNYEIVSATQEEAEFIDNRIVEFNKVHVPFMQPQTPLLKNYVIKDKGVIIAGINSCVYWGTLYIDVVFVDEQHRGKKLGGTLLHKVEAEAKAMGAILAYLNTFDFQALDFYLKHGYVVFGILEDCPKDHKRYYLKKRL